MANVGGKNGLVGELRAVRGALWRCDAPLLVQRDLVGTVQPFGFVELADFVVAGPGALVEVIAPLFARIDPKNTTAHGGIDLFLRVDSGDWVWWEAAPIAHGKAGDWQAAGLSTRFVINDGCLCSLAKNSARLELVPSGFGLIEWGCALDFEVAEIKATNALVKVWP